MSYVTGIFKRLFLQEPWRDALRRTNILGRDVPDVFECHGHRSYDTTCPQCDGKHEHEWRRVVVFGNYPEIATRCRVCGGRKCDVPSCQRRRHHQDAHVFPDGSSRPVGTS